MKPFFSVIIPVYNVENYLVECIQSVLTQDFAAWEAVLVDDGSTDSSGKMCDEWAQMDYRIHVIHQDNQGLAGARNTGLRAATGEWLLFLDSDDCWWPDFLQRLYQHIVQNEHMDVFIGQYSMISAEGECIKERVCHDFVEGAGPKGNLQKRFDYYYKMLDVAAWKMAVLHTWQTDKDLWFVTSVKYAEDVVWSLQLFQLEPQIFYIDIPFVKYRIGRPGSLTTTARPPLKNFESRITAWRQFVNGGRFANETNDDRFACAFAANKVIGEFQSQVATAPYRDEQYRQAVAMMKTNRQAARQVLFEKVSLKRYMAARLCLLLGPDGFGMFIRSRQAVLHRIKEWNAAHGKNR